MSDFASGDGEAAADEVDWSRWEPQDLATILFVRRDAERPDGGDILLIRKKRGLGAGKINGPGGRVDPGETVTACALREVREELRIEIPRIFEESGAIFVYATTEPEEALLLGGNTATLWEGSVTQFGPTPKVYRQPADATTARVFSDPPMNFLQISKTGGKLMFGEGQSLPATGKMADLPEGRYTAGFRPNHLEIAQHTDAAMRFVTKLSVTELTGSETFIHLDHHDSRWVGVIHGVHDLQPGRDLPVYLDPAHIYIFSEDGDLVSPAAYALAA